MFDEPGISLDDLPWIHRDQFVYYVEMAHGLGDPTDWPHFRIDLLEALTAAFGLNRHHPDSNGAPAQAIAPRQERALQLLDEIRRRHDPALDWAGFFDALWAGRHRIRADL